MVQVLIDGREVDVPPGSTLLDAARRLGLDLPALCYHPGLSPNTSCMACVVKLKGPERIVPSCATRAEDGMRVESETDEIRALRRTALELLLSDHVGECPVANPTARPPGGTSPGECGRDMPAGARSSYEARPGAPGDCPKYSFCRLRKYAEMYGADASRYRGDQRDAAVRTEHPDIIYDPRKCILCGICAKLAVRVGEPLGLTFIGRGFDIRLGVPLDGSLGATLRKAARACAAACPTGALTRRKAAPNPECPVNNDPATRL
jgi:NADH dehydrogenase/NADH:ubiquinone oxidoreductase subunit G